MIRQFLDASTAHLSPAAREWLSIHTGTLYDEGHQSWHVANFDFGYWLWAGDGDYKDMPDDLVTVCMYAKSKGCDYICFDRDADTIDELKEYDW